MTDLLLARLQRALGDRYAVERRLGRGGMATVFLAHERKNPRAVAVKVLHPELATGLGVERFHREIHIAAGLAHPHIVPLIDSDEADGLLRRGVVQASYQWAVGGLPEVGDEADDDWDVRLLPDDDAQPIAATRDRGPRRRVPPFVKRRGGGGARPGGPRPRAAGRRRP